MSYQTNKNKLVNVEEITEIIHFKIYVNRYSKSTYYGGDTSTEKTINNYIKNGWVITAIIPQHSGLIGVEQYSDASILYCLGWRHENEPFHEISEEPKNYISPFMEEIFSKNSEEDSADL